MTEESAASLTRQLKRLLSSQLEHDDGSSLKSSAGDGRSKKDKFIRQTFAETEITTSSKSTDRLVDVEQFYVCAAEAALLSALYLFFCAAGFF